MQQIPTQTLFVGRNLHWLPQCQSTNTWALELLRSQDLPEGTVLGTDEQQQGRGQRGNTWMSEPGANLTVSIVLRPRHLTVQNQFSMSMAAALAVQHTVQQYCSHTVQLKWPNDVYVAGRKIAGLLIESQLKGPVLEAMVVGIGLNVNQLDMLPPNATSLFMLTGQPLDLPQVLGTLCKNLEVQYLRTRQAGGTQLIRQQYVQQLMGWQKLMNYRIALTGVHIMASLVDVLPNGKAVLQTHDGNRTAYDLKEIEWLGH